MSAPMSTPSWLEQWRAERGYPEIGDTLWARFPLPWRVETDAHPAEHLRIVDAAGEEIIAWPDEAGLDPFVVVADLMAAAPLLLWLLAEARWWAERPTPRWMRRLPWERSNLA